MAAAAGGGSLKFIPLPPNTTSVDLPRVQEIVRMEYAEHKGVPLFGKTTGFFVAFTPTEGILLDVLGAIAAVAAKSPRLQWRRRVPIACTEPLDPGERPTPTYAMAVIRVS